MTDKRRLPGCRPAQELAHHLLDEGSAVLGVGHAIGGAPGSTALLCPDWLLTPWQR